MTESLRSIACSLLSLSFLEAVARSTVVILPSESFAPGPPRSIGPEIVSFVDAAVPLLKTVLFGRAVSALDSGFLAADTISAGNSARIGGNKFP